MPDRYDQPNAVVLAEIKARLTYAQANAARLGLTAVTISAVSTALVTADADYAAHIKAQAEAQGKRQKKDDAMDALEAADRVLVNQTQVASGTTDEDRKAMQLTTSSASRTSVGPPTSRPVLTIDTSQRLRHTVSFTDEATPGRRAKPAGVFGCELWHKIGGTAPLDQKECLPLGTDTASPYLAEYDGTEAGKTIYYMGRWVSTRGEYGPWSTVTTATVTG
jgi:hypothetical protein